MLRVIVLLEGKHSAQSEVLNALDWVFIKAISIFWRIKFSSILTIQVSVPDAEEQPHSMRLLQHTLLLGFYSACDVQCLLSFKHDAWNWGSSDHRILFLTVRGSFRCCFANSSCVFTEERIEFGHTAIKPRSVECCSDVCPSVDFFYLHIWSWSSTRVTIRFFFTTLTKAFSINRSVWPGGQL